MSLAEKVMKIKEKRSRRKNLKIETPKVEQEESVNDSDETASFHSPLKYHNCEYISYKVPKRQEQMNV